MLRQPGDGGGTTMAIALLKQPHIVSVPWRRDVISGE